MPNARFHNEGSIGVIFSSFEPYDRISIYAAPFSWMEAIYQYTDVSTRLYSDSFEFSRNQTYKDKGFDAKFMLYREKKFFPQIAVGFRDIAGTGLFSSEYIVGTKSVRNVDLSIGAGWGYLSNNKFKNVFSNISDRFNQRSINVGQGGEISASSFFRGKEMGLFGGMEIFFPFTKGLRFKIEYDSTDYNNEAGNNLEFDSRYNFGFTYPTSKNSKISLSYIRGNTLSFNFSLVTDYGSKHVIAKRDPHKKVKNQDAYKRVTAKDDRLFFLSAFKELKDRDIHIRAVNIEEDKLSIAFAQGKYLSFPRSYGRTIRTLDSISPNRIKQFELIDMNNDYQLSKVSVSREKFNEFSANNDYEALNQTIIYSSGNNSVENFSFKPKMKFPSVLYAISPDVQSHIGGPDRFFVGGLNIKLSSEIKLSGNISLMSDLKLKVTDTFDVINQTSDSILPHVRTDIVEYLKEQDTLSIGRLYFNYFANPYKNIYTKLSAGYFEEMFGGYGGEILFRPFERPWAISANIYAAKQRAYSQDFKFKKYSTTTGHLTLYFREKRSQVLMKLIGGRYLAEDSGITLDFSRRFKTGLHIGAFLTLTDVSKEEFGEGSFDKGFYFQIPIESFYSNYKRGHSSFGLKPLTRDGGARMIIPQSLYSITEQGSLINIIRDIDDYYE